MSLGKQLVYLRECRKWSKAEAARQLSLKYTTYVGYENDDREPSHLFLINVAKLYNVSLDYLLEIDSPSITYNFEPSKKTQIGVSENTNDIYKISDTLSPEEHELLVLWRNSQPEGQDAARAVLIAFKKPNGAGHKVVG